MSIKIKPILLYTFACIATSFAFSTASSATTAEGIQVYQRNLNQFPEHKQQLAEDITRYRNADNLWEALRNDFTLPHYEDNPIIRDKIAWLMNNQDFLLRSATRAAPYLYYISQQVKKRHLPAELVLLPIIESGYNPFSLSHAGAAGVWQLMPDTATGFGIRQDWWYDGRRDVIASTHAALNYMAYLQSFFEGNWLLAIAAYNTGEGNVLKAIRHNIREGRSTDFWSLPLAAETKVYVPMLLALAVIISHPDRYPVYFPPVRNAPYLGQVDVGSQISLKYAATLAGISYQKMLQLNSGYNHSSLSKKGPYKLVLPIENVGQFAENLSRSSLKRPSDWQQYRVRPGDTLVTIAKRFKATVTDIQQMNHLASNKNVRVGTNLLIPNHTLVAVTSDTQKPARKTKPIITISKNTRKSTVKKLQVALSNQHTNYTLQPGDTIYMVRKNDNLNSVANHFKVDASALKQANGLKSANLTPGKQIIIPTHITPIVRTAKQNKNRKILPGDTIYVVRKGDTIDKIASKFKTTSASIRITNLVDNTSLIEGDKLIIPTHLKS